MVDFSKLFVTIVFDFEDEDHVIAVYTNADDADHDFPMNYKEKKLLRTTTYTNRT